MIAETSRVGKRGTIVIPAAIRRRLRIEEGAFVIVEEREDGVLIRPAAVMPIEMYTADAGRSSSSRMRSTLRTTRGRAKRSGAWG